MRLGACLLVAVVATLMQPSMATPAPPPELLDRIVAVVDDEVILWSELNFRVLMEMQQAGSYPTQGEVTRRRERTLESMIDEQVLVSKARRDSVEVDHAEVEEMLGDELSRIKAASGPGEFDAMLERSGLTERQLKARYRKQIRHRLLHDQMLRILASRQFITRKDVDDYREAHRDTLPSQLALSQILLKVTAGEEVLAAALEKTAEARRRLDAGADFAEVARQLSEDRGTASDGGSVGCFAPGSFVPEFERAAAVLKPGEVSEPVLTQHGYHLILVREIRESEICASHILALARRTETDRRRVIERLRALRERALQGEDFADLARAHSDDPATARGGGLWQFVDKADMPPFLVPFIGHLRLGGISEPFVLEDGGRIIRLNDDHNTLESFVREQRMADRMRRMIDAYKEQIHVENRLQEEFLWDWGDDSS